MTSIGAGPGPRYGFGSAGSSNGILYVLGGFATNKNNTGSWVQLRGGFSSLPSNERVRDLANDDLWQFNSTSSAWTLLTDSVARAFSCDSEQLPDTFNRYFCLDYAGLARLSLVHHDSSSDAQGSKLYMMGGLWTLPADHLGPAWASYDIANRSWALLLSETPSGLKWIETDVQPTSGTEVVASAELANSLHDSPLFTQEAWDNNNQFGLTMTQDIFIKTGENKYYIPDLHMGPKFRDAQDPCNGKMQRSPAAVSDADGNIFLLAQVCSDSGPSKFDHLKYIKRLDEYSWTGSNVEKIDVDNVGATLFFGATPCIQGLCVFGGGMQGGDRWRERYSDEAPLGGIQDLIYYDQDLKWKKSQADIASLGIQNRYGHSMVSTGTQVYIFGGTRGNIDNTHPDADQPRGDEMMENRIDARNLTGPFPLENAHMGIRLALDDLWVCDFEQSACKEIDSKGPAGRSFFGFTVLTTASQQTLLVLFGGMGTARDAEFSDTWRFDVATWQWSNFSSVENPSGRVGHVLTTGADGMVYLFGGGRFNWEKIEQSEESLVWNTVEPSTDCFWALSTNSRQWIEQKPTGSTPSPRAFAGFTRSHSGQHLFLFGGLGRNKKELRDLWRYSLERLSWQQLDVDLPTKRFGMHLVALRSGIFVVGGEKMGELQIFKLPTPKTVPAPANALDWLRTYDLDTVDFSLDSKVWRRAQQSIPLCQGVYPCSIRLQGKAPTTARFPYNFKCSGASGCTDLQVSNLRVGCSSFALEAPMFEVSAAGKMRISNSIFHNCSFVADDLNLTIGEGAIIRASEGSVVIVNHSSFHNCSSQGNGGAMAFYGSDLQVSHSHFVRCVSLKGSGGGVWSDEFVAWPSTPKSSSVAASFTSFTKCKAQSKGGAISASASSLQLRECSFRENNAADSGGGVELNKANGQIAGTSFTKNKAESIGGGALLLLDSGVDLLANQFEDNVAPSGGGGALLWSGKPAPVLRMACGLGSFVGGTSAEGVPTCVPCAAGKFRNSFTATECEVCAVGSYMPDTGSTMCRQCAGGKFQKTPGATACQDCGANANSPVGSSTHGQCFCVAGFFGAPASSGCAKCALHADSPAGSTSSTQCFCKADFYGDDASKHCDKCVAAASSPAGSTSLAACSCNAGFIGDATSGDANACASCQAGTYAGVNGTSIQCIKCKAGTYSDTPGASACKDCDAGKYFDSIGATTASECKQCPLNALSPAGSDAKSDCQCKSGYFGDQQCQRCPSNSVSSPGTLTREDCTCNAGYFTESADCKKCDAGTYSAIHSITCSGGCGCNSGTGAIDITSTGILTDGAGDYRSSETCVWEITANPGETIKVTFKADKFKTEKGFDVVSVAQMCPRAPASDLAAGAAFCDARTPCGLGQFCNYGSASGDDGTCESCGACSGQCGSCGLPAMGTSDCVRVCEATGTNAEEKYGCEMGTLSGDLSGNDPSQPMANAADLTFSSDTGFLKIEFKSDGGTNDEGFEADWDITGDVDCADCNAGTYSNRQGSSTCLACPLGKTSPTKSSSVNDCQLFEVYVIVCVCDCVCAIVLVCPVCDNASYNRRTPLLPLIGTATAVFRGTSS